MNQERAHVTWRPTNIHYPMPYATINSQNSITFFTQCSISDIIILAFTMSKSNKLLAVAIDIAFAVSIVATMSTGLKGEGIDARHC